MTDFNSPMLYHGTAWELALGSDSASRTRSELEAPQSSHVRSEKQDLAPYYGINSVKLSGSCEHGTLVGWIMCNNCLKTCSPP